MIVPLVARAADAAPLALDHFPAAGGAFQPRSSALERASHRTPPPILLVHGYAQNRWTFHHPRRSLAAHLADRGHDTFVVELRGHGRSRALGAPWPRGVPDYLDLDLPAAVSEVCRVTAAARVVLLGHSLGGLLSLLYAGTHPEEVAGVCALSSPSPRLGASRLFRSPALRAALALALGLRDQGLAGAARRVLPFFPLDRVGALSFAFDRHVWARLPRSLRGTRRDPLLPVRPWREGSFEPAMERDRLVHGFDRTGISVAGDLLEWGVRGRLPGPRGEGDLLSRLPGVRCPVLLLASPDDETVRARYTTHAEDLPNAAVERVEIPGFGHCDLVLGTRAPADVWPLIDSWLSNLT